MRENIIAYVAAAIVMAGLDFVWLRLSADPIYHRALGAVMAEKPNMAAAVAFYVMYVLGVVIFAVRPGLTSGAWQTSLLYGALFGCFAYGTYDLTNLATLKVWSLKVSLIDMAWGTMLTGTAAAISTAITLALEK
jgi:uncharacterized membrane protein